MLTVILSLIYSSVLLYCLVSISRNYRNYLSAQHIFLSFIIKIIFGIAYGYIFLKFYNGDDTWNYHRLSVAEYHVLLENPVKFFSNIFDTTPGNTGISAIYDTKYSFWNNLEEDLFIRMLAIFNLFSFGHYYVNVILFCFIVYLGNLLLFRLFIKYYPASSFLLKIYILYVPAIVFWLSGIRKDGILFVALALTLFYFDKIVNKDKKMLKNAGFFFTALAILWLLRNFLVMCLLPALLAWSITKRFKAPATLTFLFTYVFSLIIFFNLSRLPGLPDLAQEVANRQYGFFSLQGKTRLPLDSLYGTPSSYLHVLPQALNHSFFRPYLNESKGLLQLFSALDALLFFALFLGAVFFRKPRWQSALSDPLVLGCLFTSFFGYLIIGYIVPFPGAAVRYKIIFELLFLCVFAVNTESKWIEKRLHI